VGTALPETVIPIIAILVNRRDPASVEVGIGAIAGAPFMLATLAFFVTGVSAVVCAALRRRTLAMRADARVIGRDLAFFLLLYGTAVLTTFLHDYQPLRVLVAVALLLTYVWYVRRTILAEGEAHEEINPLHLARLLRTREHTWVIGLQVTLSLALMLWGAHLFVKHVAALSHALGMSALILSMIVTPIATELPEKMNSVIWTAQKKDTLALGNLTGAMVFQSSFPVVFGLIFTHWDLRGAPMVSAALAIAGAALAYLWIRLRGTINPFVLLLGGPLYGMFVAYICRH
jgi:cation:H+ antiporter